MRRPKGRAAAGRSVAVSVINQPSGQQSRWITHLGFTGALLIVVTSLCIAWVTTRSNHSFATRETATQAKASESLAHQMANLTQKNTTYPRLQADVIDLQKRLAACYALADTIVDSGDQFPTNPTDQQAWVQQQIVLPVRAATQRLFDDNQILSASPAVHQFIQVILNRQPESASLCSRSSHTLVMNGNDQSPPVVADEKAVQKALKDRIDYIYNEYANFAKQISSELGNT
jgi:uncharacterized protein YigA (DUF484 family)